ncbi:uncharacterized protein [Labrus bergylta]|uniref:uncharacterized protein n=1 Tax=Labrus bergylta TaxID=56723 RepID=UPI0009B4AD23|nr:uncharacterized protein LOC109993558 [Labrus bergylta]
MHNWQENEIEKLLTIRASEPIRHLITGTVKDSVVYQRMSKLLAERGVYRTHMQVISKLKALRKQYLKYHQLKIRCGSEHVTWPFYEQCHRAFGTGPLPVKRPRSPSPPPARPPPPQQLSPPSPPHPPPPLPIDDEHHEVVVGLWDDVDDKEINKHLGPVEPDDDDGRYSPPEQLQPTNTTFKLPSKRRKTSVMDQVSSLVRTTVSQLKEMDASMQAQEEGRLQRLMEHEKEMQNNLMCQLVSMHERISRENHERHVELVDRILSRFPSQPGPSGQ